MMTNKVYNVLKFIALVLLPALGTLYFAVAGIWGLPAADEVVKTIVAVDTFLGVVLHLSSRAYATKGNRYDGEMHVQDVGDKKVFQMSFDDVDAVKGLEHKDEVIFRVHRVTETD